MVTRGGQPTAHVRLRAIDTQRCVRRRPRYERPFLSLLAILLACSRHDSPMADSAKRPHDTTAAFASSIRKQSSPDCRLAAFLAGARVSNARLNFESLMTCDPDGQTDRYVSLAAYRILGSHQRGDTVDAAAEVVTVAEEQGDPHAADRYVTEVRTRVDTLHWVMTRDATHPMERVRLR